MRSWTARRTRTRSSRRTETAQPNLYLLPGLGADARMFRDQLAAFPNLTILEWERPRRGDSIAEYARRMAARIPEGPFVIGGVSFGGVIAQEIAAIRRPEALILIATLTSSREIAAPLRLGASAPEWFFDCIAWGSKRFAPLAAPLYGSRGGTTRLIARMLERADPAFLSWARKRVLSWQAPPLDRIPTLRIHGDRDRMLAPSNRHGVLWIRGAGHLANMTHAGVVNREVIRLLDLHSE